MEINKKTPPREFVVGFENKNTISDCGSIKLAPNEQVTFLTEKGAEYDVTRKDWGFYATPSVNGRLAQFNLRTVIVKNRVDRFFILLVEKGKEDLFEKYVKDEALQVVFWFDNMESLKKLEGFA